MAQSRLANGSIESSEKEKMGAEQNERFVLRAVPVRY